MNDRLTNDIDFTNMDDSTAVASVDTAVDDFFGDLDMAVNGMVIDKETPEVATQPPADPVTDVQNKPEPVVPHRDPGLDNLEQRYADSSREAKRLKDRNDELEPFAPLLDRMRQDPNLINVVRGYLEGGAEPSAHLRDKLELPENFVFDGEAAFKDDKSDSAKILTAAIESVVQKNMSRVQAASAVETRRNDAFSEFVGRNKIEGEEVTDLKTFADEHDLTWDDILYIKNRAKREKEIATTARDENLAQRDKTSKSPTILAAKASAAANPEKSPEDTVFDAISGVDKGLDNLFSLEG